MKKYDKEIVLDLKSKYGENILHLVKDPTISGCIFFFNFSLKNGNAAAFMFDEANNAYYLSSMHDHDEEIGLTHKYDERFSSYQLFLDRLFEIVDKGISTNECRI